MFMTLLLSFEERGDLKRWLLSAAFLLTDSLWDCAEGFFFYIFQTTDGLGKGRVYLQYEGGVNDLLGRLKARLGSQRGSADHLIEPSVCFSSVVIWTILCLFLHLVLFLESEVKRPF